MRIAYTVAGTGPPLVYVRALNSHAEAWWTTGWTARYLRALSEAFTVVVFDARGTGLSDEATDVRLDGLVADLEAVMRETALRDVTLYGQGFGSPVAIAYAARHPQLVARLLLYCAYANGRDVVITDRFIETMRTMPEAAAMVVTRESYPDDDQLPTRLFSADAMNARPAAAIAHFEFARSVDVTKDLARVTAPTLVMQPERNPQVRRALGAAIASAIPGAVFHEIPGGAYNPFAPKSFEPSLRAIGDFIGVELTDVSRPAVLLLTDMVGSTAMTQRLGETLSRQLHALHDEVVEAELKSHNGAVVSHTGDGIMATFQSAADAARCAVAIQSALTERNARATEPLEVRVGLAHGDVYAHNGLPFAGSAQLVTRVANRAGSGEILVTEPVYELTTGSFEFAGSRSVALKGFPGRVRLHRLVYDRRAPTV